MTARAADRKTQAEQAIIVILLGVFAVTLLGALRSSGLFRIGRPQVTPSIPLTGSSSQGVPMPETQRSIPQQARSEGTAPPPVKASPKATYTAFTLRDPFRSLLPAEPPKLQVQSPQGQNLQGVPQPPWRGAKSSPTLAVQGLLWGGPEPKAIINDQVCGIGDVVQGATITSIGRDGITVEAGGETMVVAVSQEAPGTTTPFGTGTPQGRRR